MYTLYGGKYTRALITQMVMAEAGIDYDLVEIDITSQQESSAEYLAINPVGYVPALVLDSGEVLHETHAINLFLIDQHRLTQLGPLVGENGRGTFLSGLFFLADDLEPILKTFFYPHKYVIEGRHSTSMKQRALQQALERVTIIENRLQCDGPYYLGERFSLIDIICSYWTITLSTDSDLAEFPAIRRLIDIVKSRPKIRSLFKEMHQSNLEYQQKHAETEIL